MRLIVIASDSASAPSPSDTWVLRLVGTPQLNRSVPPDILTIVDQAAAEVRATFPKWLWQWISDHAALEVKVFDPTVRWWLYPPLSEKSPLRSRLIREIYWLTVLRGILKFYSLSTVEWLGDDPVFASVAASLAAEFNVPFNFHFERRAHHRKVAQAILRRILYTGFALLRWLLVRLILARTVNRDWDRDVLLYTRFPILWERVESTWRERMFGTWPDYLTMRKHWPAYAAIMSASLTALIRERRDLLARVAKQDIWILEAAISLSALLRAHVTLGLFGRYLRWRRRTIRQPVRYDDLDISKLFWREMDLAVLSPEIPFDLTVAAGCRSIVKACRSVRAIFLPFEYQPMERAVWAGVKSVRDVPVIGLQTGLFDSNQMGFSFPAEEMKGQFNHDLKSPVPDMLAAYGKLPYRVFSERLGNDRVCLSGAIRYSQLQQHDNQNAVTTENLPAPRHLVLVATSISREESFPMLEAAFRAATNYPDIFFLIKFHYHLPLHEEVKQLARTYGVDRYRIFDKDLYDLMRAARITICAGSSIGIEAIAFECMPVVFRSLGEMSSNPMLDVPDAVFFWHSITELQAALQSCLNEDDEYKKRRTAWPRAIADQLFDLNGSPDERLYQFLSDRKIL